MAVSSMSRSTLQLPLPACCRASLFRRASSQYAAGTASLPGFRRAHLNRLQVQALESGGGPLAGEVPQLHEQPSAADEQHRPQDGAPLPPPLQAAAQQQQQHHQQGTQPAGLTRAKKLALAGTLLVVTTTAIANRVLYKMALVPLGNYVFFLAQMQVVGYLGIYFAVLALRFRSGVVTPAMLRLPFTMPGTFLAIGLVEAVASLLGFIGAANLPGVVLPLLAQTILLWQVLLATTVMRKRLSLAQYLGVTLVMAGVCLAAWPAGGGSPLAGINPGYAAVFVFSMLFPALDTLLKERVFRHARAQLGADLDLFVCNSFGSLSQCAFVFALLPAMTALRGMSMADLPGYLADGWRCFRGLTPSCGADCSLSPLLPLAYIVVNLLFNVSALELIRSAGNVVMSLTMSAIVPLTILAFATPMPYLPAAPPLGPLFMLGTVVLLGGLMIFNAPLWLPAAMKAARAFAAETADGGGSAGGGAARLVASPK